MSTSKVSAGLLTCSCFWHTTHVLKRTSAIPLPRSSRGCFFSLFMAISPEPVMWDAPRKKIFFFEWLNGWPSLWTIWKLVKQAVNPFSGASVPFPLVACPLHTNTCKGEFIFSFPIQILVTLQGPRSNGSPSVQTSLLYLPVTFS